MSQTLPTCRKIRDAVLAANISIPNANAVTYSAALDLGQPNAFAVNEKLSVLISVPLVNIVSAKATTLTLEDADVNLNANFAAVTGAGIITLTGTTGNVVAAADSVIGLPGPSRQFLRMRGDGGGNSGTALTEIANFRLQF